MITENGRPPGEPDKTVSNVQEGKGRCPFDSK